VCSTLHIALAITWTVNIACAWHLDTGADTCSTNISFALALRACGTIEIANAVLRGTIDALLYAFAFVVNVCFARATFCTRDGATTIRSYRWCETLARALAILLAVTNACRVMLAIDRTHTLIRRRLSNTMGTTMSSCILVVNAISVWAMNVTDTIHGRTSDFRLAESLAIAICEARATFATFKIAHAVGWWRTLTSAHLLPMVKLARGQASRRACSSWALACLWHFATTLVDTCAIDILERLTSAMLSTL
jgi:hypothetical protein